MIHDKPLTQSLERRKTFDSPLANHFSAVMQSFRFKKTCFNQINQPPDIIDIQAWNGCRQRLIAANGNKVVRG
jgi:hypothetical protein